MGLDIYLHLFDRDEYTQRVEPTLAEYFHTGESRVLVTLLQEAKDKAGENPSWLCDPGVIQSSIDILTGDEFYCPATNHVRTTPNANTSRQDLDYYVRYTVVGQLLDILCIAKRPGTSSEQNMGRSELVRYLYANSASIESAFTGGLLDQGVPLEFPYGEYSEVVSRENVTRLLLELSTIREPKSADLRAALTGLKSMLKAALEETRLEVLLSLM